MTRTFEEEMNRYWKCKHCGFVEKITLFVFFNSGTIRHCKCCDKTGSFELKDLITIDELEEKQAGA